MTTVTTVEYLGELFQQRKRPNSLLRLMGGFQGGIKMTTAKEFPIGAFYTVPTPSQPARLEGATAPTPNNTSITQTTNVIQIFQEAVSLSYLAMGEKSIAGVVPIPQGDVNRPVQNPRSQEFQVVRTLEKIAQDANYSMMNGVFSNPSDPTSTALGTRGILQAIATNIVDQSLTTGTITDLQYRTWVTSLLASMVQYNGYAIEEQFALFCGVTEYSNIANAYAKQGTIYIQPESEIMGVKVRKVLTAFGTLLLVLDPDVPSALSNTLNANVSSAATAISLTSNAGINPGDTLNIDTGGTVETLVVASVSGSHTVNLTSALANDHSTAAVVTRGGIAAVVDMSAVGVVGMEVPGKGVLFEESLYKQGSSEQTQLYGQLGIDHAPEYLHGLLRVPYGVSIQL